MSRRSFDLDVVRDEMTVIARDLHATPYACPVRIPNVWSSRRSSPRRWIRTLVQPFPYDLDEAQLVAYLGDCAGEPKRFANAGVGSPSCLAASSASSARPTCPAATSGIVSPP